MTVKYVVRGVVQGVGFRYFVQRRASALGLTGWVSNLPDGRVQVVAQGAAGHQAALLELLRVGPPHAQVTDVEETEISDDLENVSTFEIR